MPEFISMIIPNYNGQKTIGHCLEAALASDYRKFEVIVVDDKSKDNSVEVIRKYPCKLIQLEENVGAAKARNMGAAKARGNILFFTDSDCILAPDSLIKVRDSIKRFDNKTIIGGTYTKIAFDDTFFSTFQSIFINYSETKNPLTPDYIPTHALVIDTKSFQSSGGFPEKFLPILEDVEFSHRLRKKGFSLRMNPDLEVSHIFNFNLISSLRNAFKKTHYWIIYSLWNKDLSKDSGTASIELKTNGLSFFLFLSLLIAGISINAFFLYFLLLPILSNIFVSRRLLKFFYDAKGGLFLIKAYFYYSFIYPVAIGVGGISALLRFFFRRTKISL